MISIDSRDSEPDWSVAVDVSGEPYVDLERAAAAMIARE